MTVELIWLLVTTAAFTTVMYYTIRTIRGDREKMNRECPTRPKRPKLRLIRSPQGQPVILDAACDDMVMLRTLYKPGRTPANCGQCGGWCGECFTEARSGDGR